LGCSVVICVVRLFYLGCSVVLFGLFCCYLCCSVVICVVRLLFVMFCVLFVCKCVLPPGDNPIAVNKYIIILLLSSEDNFGNDKVSPRQVHQIHTQTDGNDIRQHTAQIYNERTSTDLNLVTA
jgi:hypothetical protein